MPTFVYLLQTYNVKSHLGMKWYDIKHEITAIVSAHSKKNSALKILHVIFYLTSVGNFIKIRYIFHRVIE